MALNQTELEALRDSLIAHFGQELYNIGVETKLAIDAGDVQAVADANTYTDEQIATITNVPPELLTLIEQMKQMLDADEGTTEFDVSQNIIARLATLNDAVVAAQTTADGATSSAAANAAEIAAQVVALTNAIDAAVAAAAAAQSTADSAVTAAGAAQTTADAANAAAGAADAKAVANAGDIQVIDTVFRGYFSAQAELHRNFAEGLKGVASTDGHTVSAPLDVGGGGAQGGDGGVL